MGNESIYFSALERLSVTTSGSNDFEKIGRILANFMFSAYDFKVPEGGLGTKDGGRDGYDSTNKTKLACSLRKDYERKIKEEIEKSKKNGDLKIIYFSNQVISDLEKNRIKADPNNANIELDINGIDELSHEIENHFKEQSDPELYDLLYLSSIKVGERYQRGDAKPFNIYYNGKTYTKKILINKRDIYGYSNSFAETKIGCDPLLDFILSCCSGQNYGSFENITLCGIGYLGKSFLMKTTFDTLIKEFSDKKNYEKYSYLPFIIFRELKYYSHGEINKLIENNIDPIYVFLDGLDELNESKKIELNNEIQNIQRDNNRVRFIISGRNSSFIDFDIVNNSVQLYLEKYIDPNDIELRNLINEYMNTPIADLLPIPTYRNFVLEKKISRDSKLEEFYALLVKDNLLKDRERSDHSNAISSRMTSSIKITTLIKEISEFCYKLFLDNKRLVFTENEIKNYLSSGNDFIFFINSSIIDYHDVNNISFVSNFYYEYFVANALLTKSKKMIIQHFFTRGKVRISFIDILMFFIELAETKNKRLHDFTKKNMLKDSSVCILLCEFDSIADHRRYKYFKSIFNEYKKDKKHIYYGRFHQIYDRLKNIDNMALRMQQLLPNNYKIEVVNFLKKEILDFIEHPSKENVLSFGNAVILLIPFIKDLWLDNEQIILKELSLPLIKFFLYSDLAIELDSTLSEKFIIDWYNDFHWTVGWKQNEWEQFYEDISGHHCDLFSEIIDETEYSIKFDIFSIFHGDNCIKHLLSPILHYVIKNKCIDGYGMASVVPDTITDEYETPMIKSDHRLFILSNLLENTKIDVAEILDLLIFSIEIDAYQQLKGSMHDNPINILEEKLYSNIELMDKDDFKKFSDYYFSINELGFDERLFKDQQRKLPENIAIFLIDEILKKEIKKWRVDYFIHRLLDSVDEKQSIDYLHLIKEKVSESVYAHIIDYIFNNKHHSLTTSAFVTSEYQILFKNEILKKAERDKIIEDIKREMELVEKNDFDLIQNNEAMIVELKRIDKYLLSQKVVDDDRPKFGRIYSLKHDSILHTILYETKESIPPLFSECAIRIMEDFYRKDIVDIDKIINNLQDFSFKKEIFYIYFYWIFINADKYKSQNNKEDIDIKAITNVHPHLAQKIIDSLNKDAFDRFSNKSIEYFEHRNNQWLTPFFYYYETLLNNIPPEWLQTEYILKLIVVPDPRKEGLTSTDMSLDWLIEKFPTIKPSQLIEYGLNIIESVTNYFARVQIVKYFIFYYKSKSQNALTERIFNFIVETTRKLFSLTETEHIHSEFQYISRFWAECNSNHIDILFSKFTVEIITSAIRKGNDDFDYQYRKEILLYCSRVSSVGQRIRIICDIENDLNGRILSEKEHDEIHGFLASVGREKSIKLMINLYLNGKEIQHRHSFSRYSFGFMEKNRNVLKSFIDLFIYSTEKSTERRSILLSIARDGIQYHLTKKCFKYFEKRMLKEIKKFKKQASWQVEYYDRYLLQMEQFIYS